MKVTVCELHNEAEQLAADWTKLVAHVRAQESALVVLPEFPFYRWFMEQRDSSAAVWQAAEAAHDAAMARLGELGDVLVVGTRPVTRRGRRFNEGFIWSQSLGYQPTHHKYYLPEEPGNWEATWYDRGDGDFTLAEVGGVGIGFIICSELWFFERSRAYGKDGAHLIVTPRCTGVPSVEKWVMGGRASAVSAGAFSLSSNRVGMEGGEAYGGGGWIIDPDGAVLGVTSGDVPFLTLDLDLAQADAAKNSYPRYVAE